MLSIRKPSYFTKRNEMRRVLEEDRDHVNRDVDCKVQITINVMPLFINRIESMQTDLVLDVTTHHRTLKLEERTFS